MGLERSINMATVSAWLAVAAMRRLRCKRIATEDVVFARKMKKMMSIDQSTKERLCREKVVKFWRTQTAQVIR
jgi:hypothetical protein